MIQVAKPLSLFAFAFATFGLILFAGSTRAQPAQEMQEPPELRVLDSQEIDLGSRSIIYNRVETPVLKPQPVPVEKPTTPVAEYEPTPEELEEMRRWEALDYVSLFLNCTVYDGRLTQVSFRQGESDVVFWSTVNFHYLSHLFDLLTEDTYYTLFLSVGDSTMEEFNEQNKEFLQSKSRDLGSSGLGDLLKTDTAAPASAWRITSKGPVPAEVVRTIEDIHSYFDTNRETLIAQHAEREAARLAQEQWLRDNPPQAKDTVIQFFPIQSDHSPTEARTLESTHSTPLER